MGVVERRVDERVDLVGDLLSVSCDAFPNRLVGRRLGADLGCRVVWSWSDPPDRFRTEPKVPTVGPRRPGSDAGGPPARYGR